MYLLFCGLATLAFCCKPKSVMTFEKILFSKINFGFPASSFLNGFSVDLSFRLCKHRSQPVFSEL